MIRFVDGFDVCGETGSLMKYNGFVAHDSFLQVGIVTGYPSPASPPAKSGPYPGQAQWLVNTAFGQGNVQKIFTEPPPSSGIWGAIFYWKMLPAGFGPFSGPAAPGINPFMDWYRISNSSQDVVVFRVLPDGTWQIRDRHANIVHTTQSFTMGQWYRVEFKFQFPSGTWELRIDGTKDGGDANYNWDISTIPDRFNHRWQGFGPPGIVMDDYVIWDGDTTETDKNNDFLGPIRITTIWPIKDVNDGWSHVIGRSTGSAPASGAFACQDLPFAYGGGPAESGDNSPDGDLTYIFPNGVGANQLFQMLQSPCFGRNLAIAVNWNAKPVGATQATDAVCRITRSLRNLGFKTLTDVGNQFQQFIPAQFGYQTYQVISTVSTETNTFWTDAEINNGSWGVQVHVGTTPNQRVSQFYIEKVTALDGRSFTCGGGGPYSF